MNTKSGMAGIGLLLLVSSHAAEARGCISGAAVGGVAGHVAGHHAVVGAVAGCAINHHRDKVQDEKARAAQTAQAARMAAPPVAIPPPQPR